MRGERHQTGGAVSIRRSSPAFQRFSPRITNVVGRLLPHAILLPFVIVNLFPLFYLFTSSFKTNMDYFRNPVGLPTEWTLQSYRVLIFEKLFLRQTVNSIIVATLSVVITILVSIPAAYAYSRLRFRGREILLDFATALMAIPVVVTLVPLFVLMIKAHLVNRFPSAVIVYVGFCVPFSVYVLAGFFRSIPGELLDAARVDGASHLQIMRHVMVPLARAPLVTLSIVNGLWVWNELLIALIFLQSETSTTLMASLARGTSRDVRNVPLIMAGAFSASVPVLFLMGLGQRYFVRGFLGGHSR